LDAGDDRKKAAIPKSSAESKKEDTSKPFFTQEEKAAAAAAARDLERERVVATPTDFALDFGKGLRPTGSFDASNGKCCQSIQEVARFDYLNVKFFSRFLPLHTFSSCSTGVATVADGERAIFARRGFWFRVCNEYSTSGNCSSYSEDADKYNFVLLFRCCKFAQE
jgi:hypothetical protein